MVFISPLYKISIASIVKAWSAMLFLCGEQKTNESFAQACDEFKVLDLIYQVENNLTVEELIEPYNRKILILPIIAASWRIYEAYFGEILSP